MLRRPGLPAAPPLGAAGQPARPPSLRRRPPAPHAVRATVDPRVTHQPRSRPRALCPCRRAHRHPLDARDQGRGQALARGGDPPAGGRHQRLPARVAAQGGQAAACGGRHRWPGGPAGGRRKSARGGRRPRGCTAPRQAAGRPAGQPPGRPPAPLAAPRRSWSTPLLWATTATARSAWPGAGSPAARARLRACMAASSGHGPACGCLAALLAGWIRLEGAGRLRACRHGPLCPPLARCPPPAPPSALPRRPAHCASCSPRRSARARPRGATTWRRCARSGRRRRRARSAASWCCAPASCWQRR